MGKVQKKLGRLHEALASFNQALDLDPKSGNMIKAHIDRLQVDFTMSTHSAHPPWHIFCSPTQQAAHASSSKQGMHECMCW